jgi:hypothetical protein
MGSAGRLLIPMLVAALAVAPAPSVAGWRETVWPFGIAASNPDRGDDLKAAAERIASEPVDTARRVLAAEVAHDGHWRLVNRAGETFTAANADELKRAIATLAPIDAKAGARPRPPALSLLITATSVFAGSTAFSALPAGADLSALVGGTRYRLVRSEGQPLVMIRPRVALAVASRGQFGEALLLLERQPKRGIRLVALAPGGAAGFAEPLRGQQPGAATAEPIDPDRLKHAIAAMAGGVFAVSGRTAGELLYFQPERGPERSLLLRDLVAAAESADASLLIIGSGSGRQPGARNWLWQKAAIPGLDKASGRPTLADLLESLAGDSQPLVVTVSRQSTTRTDLAIRPVTLQGLPERGIAGTLSDLAADITGRIVVTGIDARLPSASRESELAWRLLPGMPATLQWAYLIACLLGLAGAAGAWRWWGRIWPPEDIAEYGSAAGWHAARAARVTAFALLFLPVAGFPAALAALARLLTGERTDARPAATDVTPSSTAG